MVSKEDLHESMKGIVLDTLSINIDMLTVLSKAGFATETIKKLIKLNKECSSMFSETMELLSHNK